MKKKNPPQILEIYILQYLKRELDLLERVALPCADLKRKQGSETPPPSPRKTESFFLFLINIAMLPKNNTPSGKKNDSSDPRLYMNKCLNYFWSLNSFRTCVNQTYGLLPAHTSKLTIVEVLRVLQ